MKTQYSRRFFACGCSSFKIYSISSAASVSSTSSIQLILKRFSGYADHVSNPDRLKLAGVCQLIGRGFSNAENSSYVLPRFYLHPRPLESFISDYLRKKPRASPHNCVCGLRPIFRPIRAGVKGGNTYSIPALLSLSYEAKSLAECACQIVRCCPSFAQVKLGFSSVSKKYFRRIVRSWLITQRTFVPRTRLPALSHKASHSYWILSSSAHYVHCFAVIII